ncbi:hypothetical protein [Flavobacterium sp.]|uniref:hypothetical protein n=1 Tax=Flavobacterium sp. TaxID=239 RepID=UPI0032654AAE
MARKDDIFISFIKHELIREQYNLTESDLPLNLKDGIKSDHTIIKAIALIVENTEGINPLSDKALYGQITQFLNEATT